MEGVEREFRRSQRKGAPLALLMIDIDHFKQVNDRYGHQQGDRALIAVAEVLRGHLRPYDLAARFGGEEFCLLLPETALAEALQVGERVRSAVAGHRFSGPLAALRLTVSLGAAVFPGSGITSSDDLIRCADDALYEAKRAGRNRLLAAAGAA